MGVCYQKINECECLFFNKQDPTNNENEKSKINILWIDPNVNNEENLNYQENLKNLGYTKINFLSTIKEGLNILQSIKFEETFIIVSGGFYLQFINNFKKILKDIYVIPKVLVFTSRKAISYLDNGNNEIKNKSFYNFGGFQMLFEDIKNLIVSYANNINFNYQIKEKEKNLMIGILSKEEEHNNLIFEYIDKIEKLVLPSLYKILLNISSNYDNIIFSNQLYNKYKNYTSIKYLLESINIKEIPSELLSKYYLRIYTNANSYFYKDINKDLRENKKEIYLSYINVLYEGLYTKALPLASNNTLYRGSKLSNDEINKIKTFLKNKIPNLPGAIVFSKCFLSFSKDINIARRFLNGSNDSYLSKVFFILEKDNNIDYSLATHSDIENISFYPHEKEVLFFPFSSFEIKDIEEEMMNNERIYKINLKYLGKYIKEFQYIEKEIPNSIFKEEILKSHLIEENKVECKNIKKLYNYYDLYKKNLEKQISEKNIIFQSDEFNNWEKEEILNQFKNDYDLYNLFKELKEIQEDLIMGPAKLSRQMLDPKGNKLEGWSINEKRGGFEYDPPLGWIGFGLKVKGMYEDDYWIDKNNISNWCNAYYGVGDGFSLIDNSDQIKKIIGIIIKSCFKPGQNQFCQNYQDIYHLCKKKGVGVYFNPNINHAECYAGIININWTNYKVVLMVKIKPSSIRSSIENKEDWITNGSSDETRPYRILFKKYKYPQVGFSM